MRGPNNKTASRGAVETAIDLAKGDRTDTWESKSTHFAAWEDDSSVTSQGKCRKRGHPSSWIRPEKRKRIYARDGYVCVYCDIIPNMSRDFTLDHVRARSNGGQNHHTNLITACRSCNSSRQNKPLKQWCEEKGLDYYAIHRRVRNAVRRKLP